MKTINVFGRKMPILAILMSLLVIGTASAAVYANYATLDGDAEVVAGIYMIDSSLNAIYVGGTGDLNFDEQMATFDIMNDYDGDVYVEFVTTIWDVTEESEPIMIDDETHFSVVYTDGFDVLLTATSVEVPIEGLTVNVELVTAPNVEGSYNVEVVINPTTPF